uniref:DNA replication licensing factor MCM4 n=1 Tax=Tetradesmus obliquus TaxID=3088 RepID=A0A383VUH6_TETOB|eukprot:jgi/Sobl393_1/3150/SZX68851.1
MADSQGTPSTKRTDSVAPFSPASAKSSGRRRAGGRRASGPLASLPSNIQDDDLPMLDSQATGPSAAAGGTAGTAAAALAGKAAAAAGRGRRAGSRRTAAGGGGGDDNNSDEDMQDADQGAAAGGGAARGVAGTPGGTAATPGNTSELLPTPGMGAMPSSQRTPGRPGVGGGMRSRASSFIPSAADSELDGNRRIWGTAYTQSEMTAAIRRFLVTFHAEAEEGAQQQEQPAAAGLATYVGLLRQMMADGHTYINIDAQHIKASSPRLLAATVESPEDMLLLWDEAINRLAREQTDLLEEMGLATPEDTLQTRVFNLDNVRPIRDLDPVDIDSLVAVRGMVTRSGNIIPDLRLAVFRCETPGCGAEAHDTVERGLIVVPNACTKCGKKATMRMIPNRSGFLNRQIVKMQEDPTHIPEGETPRSLLSYAYDTNVDAAKPGDKVTITGIFRAAQLRVNPRQRASHALFKTYLDVLHVAKDEADRLFRPRGAAGTQGESLEATQTQGGPDSFVSGNLSRQQLADKEAKFRAMAADPQHFSKLIASVAPRVIDMDNVKKGLLCQLFGGVAKSTASALGGDSSTSAGGGSKGGIRGDINVLVVGDPSVSKSQLLGFVHHVAPRGIYTSGKGSSAVGLTAYVTRDPETNEMVLESGALVLSDRGICCIDEFDKMSDGARAMLHEVMEQQTVSVAKAGLVSQLNARTSILACANPKGSRYLPELSLAENINLPPSLLSRFDLVYLVLDTRDTERDRKLAKHLISLFWREVPANTTPPYSAAELREFVAFARARIAPSFSAAAEARLIESYKELRRNARNENSGRVSATPRQLEAMIRMSEALARMHLRTEVTEDDVRDAYRLWHDALSVAAADEEGRLDVGLLSGGTSGAQRQFMEHALPQLLRGLLNDLFAARPTVSLQELHSSYMQTYAEQKERQQQLGQAGAQEQQQQQLRPITPAQLQMAIAQLTDMVNMRGGILSRKQQQQPAAAAEAAAEINA